MLVVSRPASSGAIYIYVVGVWHALTVLLDMCGVHCLVTDVLDVFMSDAMWVCAFGVLGVLFCETCVDICVFFFMPRTLPVSDALCMKSNAFLHFVYCLSLVQDVNSFG